MKEEYFKKRKTFERFVSDEKEKTLYHPIYFAILMKHKKEDYKMLWTYRQFKIKQRIEAFVSIFPSFFQSISCNRLCSSSNQTIKEVHPNSSTTVCDEFLWDLGRKAPF